MPFVKLKVNVGNSLKSLLTRLRQQEAEKTKAEESKVEDESKPL